MPELPVFGVNRASGGLSRDADGMYGHQELHCRECGQRIDAATPAGHGNAPVSGSVSVCFHCAALGIYVIGPLGVALREPTEAEQRDLLADTYIVDTIDTIRRFWATRPRDRVPLPDKSITWPPHRAGDDR